MPLPTPEGPERTRGRVSLGAAPGSAVVSSHGDGAGTAPEGGRWKGEWGGLRGGDLPDMVAMGRTRRGAV